ncbi:MAG TPA: amidohydrolase family protein [Steroidobacteraceae bacterium]|nr:amidohydrolase family protein [Steroidobacteraceae bacterium]
MNKTESPAEGLNRRAFLAGAGAVAATAASGGALAQTASADHIPIIDAHIHLFDNTRPLGAGYMGSKEYRALNKPSLPAMYSAQAKPLGVVGAIVVESSFFIDDNLFYLDVCRADPFMVGVSGTLNPDQSDFGRYVTHFQKDPLFRAIRASRFYTADNDKVALKPDNVANLKLLAQADLALDTANPTMNLMQANVMLADAVPELRIIMDHLPSFDPTPDIQQAYEAVVKDMASKPNIFVKLTEVYHPRTSDGFIVKDYEFLRDRLEFLFEAFGEDRVIFGSDYPNSYGVATIPEEVGLVKQFFAKKSRAVAEKYFWKNSARVYKWKQRRPDQPVPA